MFTGIVEEMGSVVGISVDEADGTARLTVLGRVVTSDSGHGASIAVNGVCLTVTDEAGRTGDTFTADVMGETLTRTNLGLLQPGAAVNLERAMAVDGRFGGHVVQGHVDGVGTLIRRESGKSWETVRFSVSETLARYLVEKGSITVDGVSLTVSAVSGPGEPEPWFEVGLIPTTLRHTTLGVLEPGANVNLELDVVAKYVERLAAFAALEPQAPAREERS